MMFQLIKFTSKSAVRKLLRNYRHVTENIFRHACFSYSIVPSQKDGLNMKAYSLQMSSIYSSNTTNYILLGGVNLSSILSIKGIDVCDELNETEKQIYKWAMSEILQSVEFIQFEHKTSLSPDLGRVLSCNTGSITRTFDHLTEIYGILNYTPDSFSDGGKYQNIESLCDYAKKQIAYGVSILDVGVESTNPMSAPMCSADEIKRLSLVFSDILELKKTYNVAISIDTYHNETIKWLLDKDIDIINDVSGNVELGLVKEITLSGKKYIAMHSLVVPAKRDIHLPIDENPVDHIYGWMERKLNQLDGYGVSLDNIILDPGIGFGMISSQAWFILNNFDKFYGLPCELMLGHSRKSFFKHIVEKSPEELDLETACVGVDFINKVDYLRIHDIRVLAALSRVN